MKTPRLATLALLAAAWLSLSAAAADLRVALLGE